ncbi:hypothetical protein QOZ80_1AG0041670 [Eleusine coracana subsp. coracana]|nr:hypothetical protein QOZ80_1AG0041670 [Eleusine coracana subsp. coracana]
MAEGSSNLSGAPLSAGAVGRIVDGMRDLDLSSPPELQLADHGSESLSNSRTMRDWAHLHQDLLVCIFSRLELLDLVHSGAVCMSWHISYLAVRRFGLCSPNKSPYLIYSSRDRGSNTATLHNLSTNKHYHFPLPDPPFRSRYIVGSSQGWLVTDDEQSSLELLNPITGAQVLLPPAQSIKGVRLSFTSDGELYDHYMKHLDVRRQFVDPIEELYLAEKTRHFVYQRVILSSDPSGGDYVVLLKHGLWNHLSFARAGDTKWTWLDTTERCDRYDDFFYNQDDGLFYAVRCNGEIHTIDLNGLSPVVEVILNPLSAVDCHTHYILRAPWGDLLQIRRLYGEGPPDSDDDDYIAYQQQLVDMYLGQHQHELDIADDEEACPPRG